jgi:hypothetical protein
MRPNDELLYDSEASLRLVDHAIEELSSSGAELDRDARGFLNHMLTQPGGFTELSRTLLRAYAETQGIVDRIRQSCGAIDNAGIDKLQQMHGRLSEVSSATELAATDILDGISRTLALVEDLDADQPLPDDERHSMLASVKEELGGVAQHLQFQDITAQQLAHIASLLEDMRRRSDQMMEIFAPQMISFAAETPKSTPAVAKPASLPAAQVSGAAHSAARPFDPNASMSPSEERQAIADEIFAIRTDRKAS